MRVGTSSKPHSKPKILFVGKNFPLDISIVGRLKNAGFDLISAHKATDAIAKLFANRRVQAVVLDQRRTDNISLGLARFVKSFRAAVPVILLSTQLLDPLPRCIDAGVCVQDELGGLVPTIQMFLDNPDGSF